MILQWYWSIPSKRQQSLSCGRVNLDFILTERLPITKRDTGGKERPISAEAFPGYLLAQRPSNIKIWNVKLQRVENRISIDTSACVCGKSHAHWHAANNSTTSAMWIHLSVYAFIKSICNHANDWTWRSYATPTHLLWELPVDQETGCNISQYSERAFQR